VVLDVCGFFYAGEFVEGLHCVGCRGVSAFFVVSRNRLGCSDGIEVLCAGSFDG
jgi:hypothetical protein